MRKQPLLFLAILALGLAGCGQQQSDASNANANQEQAVTNANEAAVPTLPEQQSASDEGQQVVPATTPTAVQPQNGNMTNDAMGAQPNTANSDNAAQAPAAEDSTVAPTNQQPSNDANTSAMNQGAANIPSTDSNRGDNTDTIDQD